MTQKPKPLLCLDTHAGAGIYTVNENGEWAAGAGMLFEINKTNSKRLPAPVSDYLEIAIEKIPEKEITYRGSPALMGILLRDQDRLVCSELHPGDFQELEKALNALKGISPDNTSRKKTAAMEARNEDGMRSLKSLLPPPYGRGLILIDPSWEEKNEFAEIPMSIAGALKRFPNGTYIVWYPLLLRAKTPDSGLIGEKLFNLYEGNRCRLELYNPKAGINAHSPRGMYGSGLVIYNPPWTLKPVLDEMLPWLAGVLLENGEWNLEWKE